MSNKNKPSGQSYQSSQQHQAEYRIIKMDLIKVLILNVIYLAVIFSLYFLNQKSSMVDNWFAKLLRF